MIDQLIFSEPPIKLRKNTHLKYNNFCDYPFPVCGEVEALETVLSAGAEPSTPDIHGGYPIHYASQMCGHASEMGNDVRVGESMIHKKIRFIVL